MRFLPASRPVLVLIGLLTAGLAAPAADFTFGELVLTVPDGFTIERVAATPLVDRPIAADFDLEGRLYVSDSSGSNDEPEKQLALKPHRIVRLTDTTGSGIFDQATVFADRMMFPAGALFFEGSFYVGAPPSIWKITDTNNDGVADQREEWMQGKTLTACANDLHGPYAGPDGWIYWAKGAFAEQTHARPGKTPFVSRAAHIFRSRPDGTGIEPVMTGGMDNPVAVVFTPTGERIVTATFLQEPEDGKRDGLIHAVYGGVYGKVNDVNDDHPRTGDLLPVLSHLGAAAPCGMARYASEVFGTDYRDNLFVCSFNLHKVIRHVLTPDGATYKSTETDFITSNNPDFHPTDVKEDADGSLIVVDTGGWYKLCCPTSQLAKPDVLGAIYRVRRVGAPKVTYPRGHLIKWNEASPAGLVDLLADPRPFVRDQAIAQLGKLGAPAVAALREALKPSTEIESQRNAMWALTRIDHADARAAVRAALAQPDASVRHLALNSISLWRDAAALDAVLPLLRDPDAGVRRIAAEAAGRIADARAVPALLTAAGALQAQDRMLEHSLTFALIEIADPAATAAGLDHPAPAAQRAALLALDQMPGDHLPATRVTPLLTSADPLLRATANWIVDQHRDWGRDLAVFFDGQLRQQLSSAASTTLGLQLARSAADPAIQALIGQAAVDAGLAPLSRRIALRAMADASLKETPPDWLAALGTALATREPELLVAAVATARSLARPADANPVDAALGRVARDPHTAVEVRLAALAASKDVRELEPELFALVASQLDATKSLLVRSNAASVLATVKRSPEQALALADLLSSVGPLELNKLVGAFRDPLDETTGRRVLERLNAAKSLSGLRPDLLEALTLRLPEALRPETQAIFARLNVDVAKQKQHLDDVMKGLLPGDIRRGQLVFNNPQFACASCHAMGYQGGTVGPDLTSVGKIRTERDLLEAIVYPSASFVRSFEPYSVTTKSGETHGGLLRKDGAEEIVLLAGVGAETRIPRSEIVEMAPGTISVMPQGLDLAMTKQELSDLIAFLKATTWGAQ